MRGRVIEAHGTADQAGGRAAAAVTQDRVTLADALVPQLIDARRRGARLAREAMALPVRDEREVARLEPARPFAFRLEPASARGHDVEAQAPLPRRERERPGRRQLRAA